MPRKFRFHLPGILQHIIPGGNSYEPRYLAERDYRRCLDDPSAVARRHCYRMHAYVLMTNDVHMLSCRQRNTALDR